jgi:hypothetical protein
MPKVSSTAANFGEVLKKLNAGRQQNILNEGESQKI